MYTPRTTTTKRHTKNTIGKSKWKAKKCSSGPKEDQKKKKENKKKTRKNKLKTNNKIVGLSPNLLIITLDVDGLHIPIKTQRLA